jgi:hypothetical protein
MSFAMSFKRAVKTSCTFGGKAPLCEDAISLLAATLRISCRINSNKPDAGSDERICIMEWLADSATCDVVFPHVRPFV